MTHLLFKQLESTACGYPNTYTVLNSNNIQDKLNYKNVLCRDPRLYRGVSNDYICLDRQPLMTNTNCSHTGVYSKQNYNDPRGDVVYYVPNEYRNIYIDPLFSNTYKVSGYLYKDPMDSVKLHFTQCRVDSKPQHMLSWINDSEIHRETIMAKQMYNINNRFASLL